MDPTVDVLTIYPAAWAALFQGLAEGLIYGLVGVASVAIAATVLTVTVGGCCAARPVPGGLAGPSASQLATIVPAAWRPARQQARRRRRA